MFIGDKNKVKLGDFGLSKTLVNESLYAYTNVGTPYYMSPEQINEERYNHKSDVWSLGCIIYETVALKPPFQAENYLALAVKIKEGKIGKIPSHYSKDLQTVIEKMLKVDPSERPSIEDLINKNSSINVKVRELKVKEKINAIIEKEKLLENKEKELQEISTMLEKRIIAVEEREKKVTELETQYKALVSIVISNII